MKKFRFPHLLTICLAWLLLVPQGHAQQVSDSATGPHIEVFLVSEYQQLQVGENWLGVLFKPESEWHTYWRNPGDSGEAPTIEWQLPEGVTAGEIQWPIPYPIKVAHLVNYGYEGANLLMVPISLTRPVDSYPDELAISANVSWLVCKEDCIPGWATLSTTLTVTERVSGNADQLFTQTRENLPSSELISGSHEITDQGLVVSVDMQTGNDWMLLPFRSDVIQHNGAQQYLSADGLSTFVLNKSDYFTTTEQPLAFLLTNGEEGRYLTSTLNLPAPEAPTSVLIYALMALAGGLLLNLMPCVLPVLAIKAMSVQQASHNLAIKLGYGIGVVLCFNLFALLILALKATGQSVGWGFHMQEPVIIAALAFLFTLIALILLDVAPQGSRLAGLGQNLVQGNSVSSQFFTGVLAVIVASPCTAPFMAAALGIAMVSDAMTTLAIFNALAMGFALPLTLIYFIPSLANRLPKPGQWMVTFRQFLAFPMFATVLWLGWIYLNQTSSMSQLLLFTSLLMFSLFIWLASKTRRGRYLCYLGIIVSVSMPMLQSNDETAQQMKTAGSFSVERLNQLRAQNKVVLVNMTADWCITCKVNEQVAFTTDTFTRAIASEHIEYLVGDWTNKNTEILNYLTQYQRSGVPLYVVYAGQSEGQVLPQILTADVVVEALEQALKETNRES